MNENNHDPSMKEFDEWSQIGVFYPIEYACNKTVCEAIDIIANEAWKAAWQARGEHDRAACVGSGLALAGILRAVLQGRDHEGVTTVLTVTLWKVVKELEACARSAPLRMPERKDASDQAIEKHLVNQGYPANDTYWSPVHRNIRKGYNSALDDVEALNGKPLDVEALLPSDDEIRALCSKPDEPYPSSYEKGAAREAMFKMRNLIGDRLREKLGGSNGKS